MWNFQTDPEFQAKLDWADKFVREEVYALDVLFSEHGDPYDVNNKKSRAILKPLLTDQHLVISILAGKTRENMAAAMGRLGRMVRVMPNLPASVGYGVR